MFPMFSKIFLRLLIPPSIYSTCLSYPRTNPKDQNGTCTFYKLYQEFLAGSVHSHILSHLKKYSNLNKKLTMHNFNRLSETLKQGLRETREAI